MSFMWNTKTANNKAATEEDDDEGEEILSSCNSSRNNNHDDDDKSNAGRIQHQKVPGGGNGGDTEAATISKSNDYINRVTSETLFPSSPTVLDPVVGSSIPANDDDDDASFQLSSPPSSPMSMASTAVDDQVMMSSGGGAVSLFGEAQENDDEQASPSSSSPSTSSSKLSMKPEGLSDSLLDEVAPRRLSEQSQQRPLVETVGPKVDEDSDDDDDDDDDEDQFYDEAIEDDTRPSNGRFMEPRDGTVVVTLQVDYESVGKANAQQQQQPAPLASPPTDHVETLSAPQDEASNEGAAPALTETTTSQPNEDAVAINGQYHILPWLHFPSFQLPTAWSTTLVYALGCMVVIATTLGILSFVYSFLYHAKMSMTVPPSSVIDIKEVSPVPIDAYPLGQKNPRNTKQPNTTLVQAAQETLTTTTMPSMVAQPPLPLVKDTVSLEAVILSTAAPVPCKKAIVSTITALNMADARVSKEIHEEQQGATKVPSPPSKWSIVLFMNKTVCLSMLACLLAFILWFVPGGNSKQAPRTKPFPPVGMTDLNFETIRTTLQEPMSGKGRHTKTMMTTKDLGWDPINYEQLTLEEIHRLLHLLHAPSYNRSMNKSLLLGLLHEHYGTVLHKCTGQQLSAILRYKQVRYSCGTKKLHLVHLALHAGFTSKHY